MKKPLPKKQLMYQCPFCDKTIVSSKKTEVYYKNQWINGCNDCFSLSIDKQTMKEFQIKNY